MEVGSKGISLRKKRTVKPKISAPRQISGPLPITQQVSNTSSTSEPPPPPRLPSISGSDGGLPSDPRPRLRERPSANDKTADLVKRRYSTRYNQLPTEFGFGAPAVPTIPTLPDVELPPSRDGRPSTSGRSVRIDQQALKDPNLRPEQYIASVLADASESEIQAYQHELRKLKNRTSVDLQASVFQNRSQFIKISKEAEKVKGELRTLRSLISELTATMGQTNINGATALGNDTASSRRNNRSSVANLEALWGTQLQTLWKRVEGSQKYLPAVPGRHVVYESGRWVELNAATWKPRRRVHLIFLNDHLLVATDKKRADAAAKDKSQNPSQLVAIRCFPLQDVQIADLSPVAGADGKSGTASVSKNAINVRVGAESFTFATGSSEASEKSLLLTSFRKAAEDLRKTLESESQTTAQSETTSSTLKRLSTPALGTIGLLGGLTDGLSGSQAREVLVDVDGSPRSTTWLQTQLDDLDIDIAVQRFEEAVARLEHLRRVAKGGIKGYAALQAYVLKELNNRAASLAAIILRNLADTNSWMNASKQNVGWLSRLGFDDRAREAYLNARSAVIKKRIRECNFDGDLHIYIYQLSFIYFTILRDTILIYQHCFPMNMLSACITWAKGHVDEFNSLLERQLSSVDTESRTYAECLERVRMHAELMKEAGVDFKGIVGVGLAPGVALSEQPGA